LRAVESTIGDWIVYYEPRRTTGDTASRGGRQSYFATARVIGVRQDSNDKGLFFADVQDYLEFDHAVPFKEGEFYYENGLQRSDGGTSKGAFGRAVRPITDREQDLILRAGFAETLSPESTRSSQPFGGVAEEQATIQRPIIERMVARPFRDAVFSSSVRSAYANTCAITGIKIINGGGRPEVQAAHIRPVSELGPDSVRNGIALCATVHWMFDRGLLSLDEDLKILKAPGTVPEPIERLINPTGHLLLPDRLDFRPHPQFMKFHREYVFKG
jgi:putative restriction endonuclease